MTARNAGMDTCEKEFGRVIGARVTVNFEHAGKLLINTEAVALEAVDLPP